MTQQINLLDAALLPQRDWCNARFIVGTSALWVALVGGQWVYEKHALSTLLAASAPVDAEQADTLAIDAEIAELSTQLAGGEALLRTAGGLTELPQESAARVQALIDAMPQNLWLDEVEFGTNQRVRISGGVGDAAGLAAFSQRLGESGAYNGLPLRVVALAPRESEAPEPSEASATLKAPPMNAAFQFVLASTDAAVPTAGELR
ncbi:MAG: hypothetical protein K2X42_02265 [Burkholderiaceae bacterium]|nr:hypothetical protein [Burkholderiaceae bacterium]